MVKSYARKAGIARVITPHALRHTTATELSSLGTPLPVIQGVLGHADVRTTQRYVHVNGIQRRSAIDALGRHWVKTKNKRPKRPQKPVD